MQPIATFSSLSLPAMEALACALARKLRGGDTVTLEGELGAGKTTFARAAITAIAQGAPEVTSPTFNIMQSYDVRTQDGTAQTLWHLDLYRIEESRELGALGLEELWPHIVFIEWPQVAEKMLPEERLEIIFVIDPTRQMRTLTLYGNEAWLTRLARLV